MLDVGAVGGGCRAGVKGGKGGLKGGKGNGHVDSW